MSEKRVLAGALVGIVILSVVAAPAFGWTPRLPGRDSRGCSRPAGDVVADTSGTARALAGGVPTRNGISSAASPSTFSDRFGVCDPHLMFHGDSTKESLMSRMESAGLSWVRMVFAWSDLEPSGGTFAFAAADRAVASARRHGVRILGILGFPPPWANGGQPPGYPPAAEHLSGWRRYVRTVCARYKNDVCAWEIWNEENTNAFWMPEPDAAAFVELVGITTPEIRAADPGATVVLGGVAGLDLEFQHACLDLGVADHVDAMAYHPYTWTLRHGDATPREQHAADIVAGERALISQHTGRPLQVWLTEFGWTTYEGEPGPLDPPPVDEQTRADYLLRSLVNYADAGADRVFVHCLWDEGSDPTAPEDNFGLISNDLSLKRSCYRYGTFQHVIGQALYRAPDAATFACSRPDTLRAHSFILDDGSLAVAAWKADDRSDTLDLTVSSASFELPRRVDLFTGGETNAGGASFDGRGRARVKGLGVGKTPAILRFPPSNSEWYMAEGTTAWGFDTYLSIMNPNPVPVTAEVEYMTISGPATGPAVEMPAMSQATVNPRETLGSLDFSTKVTCRQRLPIAADRTMTWTGSGAVSPEAHSCVGVTAPATTWYLPEGSSAWGFETWLLIQNPGEAPAEVSVTYMPEGSAPVTVKKRVPPGSRRSYSMAEDIGALDASMKVSSDLPVIPERAMYRYDRRSGHDSTGETSPGTEYFLAEGSTACGFTTYVLVQNPDATDATVTLTFMIPEGPVEQPAFVMTGNSRKTVRVNDLLPSRDLSVRVRASRPVVAERAMYWDAGTGEACHDSIGTPSPRRTFYLPDGQTSGGRETWTLVQNPNPSPATVQVTYLTPSGAGNPGFRAVVPAYSRRTFRMADVLPSGRAAVVVTCVTAGAKIVVERSMYWSGRGAGTCSAGASTG